MHNPLYFVLHATRNIQNLCPDGYIHDSHLLHLQKCNEVNSKIIATNFKQKQLKKADGVATLITSVIFPETENDLGYKLLCSNLPKENSE